MIILMLVASPTEPLLVAHIEVDDNFNLGDEADREHLLSYLEEETELDVGDVAMTAIADGSAAPTFLDQDGDAIVISTYALPPREVDDEDDDSDEADLD